jgi:hypothetical protein
VESRGAERTRTRGPHDCAGTRARCPRCVRGARWWAVAELGAYGVIACDGRMGARALRAAGEGVLVKGGGGAGEVRLRKAAAGVVIKVDEVSERWRRSMIDFSNGVPVLLSTIRQALEAVLVIVTLARPSTASHGMQLELYRARNLAVHSLVRPVC